MALRPSSRLTPFYRKALALLERGGVSTLIGGAYALAYYSGIERDTKDLDLFLAPADCPRALELARAAGLETSVEAPHWLAKIRGKDDVVDLLFGSGNGLAGVDAAWFEHAVPAEFDGVSVLIAPVEEMIWQKAFVMERHRYDGADVAHLLRARAGALDWRRLLDRFAAHWPVLLSHLVLFPYVFPAERPAVPEWVWAELLARCASGAAAEETGAALCRGTFLSNFEYIPDIARDGLRDARLRPLGPLSPDQLASWNRHLGVH